MVGKSPYSSFREEDMPRRVKEKLRQIAAKAKEGGLLWDDIDLTSSDHNDIATIQGGTTNQYYHLTATEHEGRMYRINVDTTQTGNVGSGEDDLITYTLPADTVNATGESLIICAFGTTAANGNNKTIKIHLGSTELGNASANTPNDQDWCFDVRVIRTGASAGKALVKFFSNTSSDNTVDYKSISEDFTTNLVIKCTGEGTSNDDIVQEAQVVEVLK